LLLQTPPGPPCGVAAVVGGELGVVEGVLGLVRVGDTGSADGGVVVVEAGVAGEVETSAADGGAAWGDVPPLVHAAASTDKAVPSNVTVVVDLIAMNFTFV